MPVLVFSTLLLACNGGADTAETGGFGPRGPTPDSPHAGCTPGTELTSVELLNMATAFSFSADAAWGVLWEGNSWVVMSAADLVRNGDTLDYTEALPRFSPDGTVVGAGYWYHPSAFEWTPGDIGVVAEGVGSELSTLGEDEKHQREMAELAWSPDGRLLASGDLGGDVIIWDVLPIAPRLHITTPEAEAVQDVAWDPSGSYLAVASGSVVYVYDTANGDLVSSYTGHVAAVWGVEWEPAELVHSAALDREVHRWDGTSGELVGSVRTEAYLRDVAVFPSGGYAVSGDEGFIAVYDDSDTLVHQLQGAQEVRTVIASPDDTVMLTIERPPQAPGVDTLRLWCR